MEKRIKLISELIALATMIYYGYKIIEYDRIEDGPIARYITPKIKHLRGKVLYLQRARWASDQAGDQASEVIYEAVTIVEKGKNG